MEEAPADPGEREQFTGDGEDGRGERGAVLGDQEGQGVQDSAEEGAEAGDRAA